MSYQVLIVDDEEIVCRGMAQFVKWQEHGFSVSGIVYLAEEGLKYLEHHHIDVIFLDIRMPQMSGLEMLKIIAEKYPSIKTVILSGFSEFSYAKEAIRYGAYDYLNKPVNLKEIENLLDRLALELDKEEKESTVKRSRLEALLLSIARGHSKINSVEQYEFPPISNWYGLSMEMMPRGLTEETILQYKDDLRQEIELVIPDAIILNNQIYGMFALIPFQDPVEISSFINILEQAGQRNGGWFFGGSKYKNGYLELPDAYDEAEQALRYNKAREGCGIIWYKNIEMLFPKEVPEMSEVAGELVSMLTNPEERDKAVSYMEMLLNNLLDKQLSMLQIQTACIGGLIELNGNLQNLKLKTIDLRESLNSILERILLCHDFQGTKACILDYVKKLSDKLCEADEQQISKGIIYDIQMYIKRHYQEPITLQHLAEQFYLHPNYLSRLFKEKTGQNFIEYITEIRMNKVKEMLEDPDAKISDISQAVGYENPRYFSKVFKQTTGVTPSEYREQITNHKDTSK